MTSNREINRGIRLGLATAVAFRAFVACAHDEELHGLMSLQAAISSENLFTFTEQNLPGPNPLLTFDSKTLGPISWVETGSRDEDHPSTITRHHFYAPVPRPPRALSDGVHVGDEVTLFVGPPIIATIQSRGRRRAIMSSTG